MLPSYPDLFQRTDDGAGGPLQTFKRRLKFALRYWWWQSSLQALHAHLERLGLAELLNTDPTLLFKITRAYLWSGLSGKERLAAQLAHFDWLVGTMGVNRVLQLYRDGNLLLAQWQRKDAVVSACLQPGRGLGREGELELHLNLNDGIVMRSSFSVLPNHLVGVDTPGPVMVLGSLQGSYEGKDLVKDFTQQMERTRPSGILHTVLQGLAAGWGVVDILGVSDKGHIYADYGSLAKRVGVRYDTIWQELGAEQPVTAMHWRVPLVWMPRPEEEVPSSKRSQLRRRNALRQTLFDDCRAAAQNDAT